MTDLTPYILRNSSLSDEGQVGSLLSRSYAKLLEPWHSERLLAGVLPLMTRAQPALLSAATYYVVHDHLDQIVGCGGWTHEGPGGRAVEPGLGHIRHFATDPNHLRRGIARSILNKCIEDGRSAGLTRFECHSTLAGEAFYEALGFRTERQFEVRMGPALALPAKCMILEL